MKIYRVSYEDIQADDDGHKGYSYHGSKREAEQARKDAAETCKTEIEQIEVEPTKAGIITALNGYGGHADNG